MKYLSTIVLLTAFLSVEGQNVNFPDYRFKWILVHNAGVNTNGDQEIQESEALAVTNLTIDCEVQWASEDSYYFAPEDITGIKSFANLQRLTISSCQYGGERNIDLDGMVNLRYLKIDSDTALTTLTVNGCIALDSLVMEGDYSVSTHLNSLDLRSCINLSFLECVYVHGLQTLRLEGCVNLKKILLAEILDSLDISGLVNLEDIQYQLGGYLRADLRGSTHIRNITATEMSGINLNVEGCSNLESLSLSAYNFPNSLDLSTVPNLKTLYLAESYGDSSLRELNIKNGSALENFYFNYLTGLRLVCADESETDTLRQYFEAIRQNVIVNSYCNLLGGGLYNTITGKTKLALAGTSCENTSLVAPQVAIKFSDSSGHAVTQFTSAAGSFRYYTDKGRYTLLPSLPFPYYAITPSFAEVLFDTANSLIDSINFCVQPDGVHNDIEITFLPTGPAARPGFNAGYTLVYKNKGTAMLSGSVHVNFDNSKMNFVSSSAAITSQSTGQLTWNYNNLQPFESRNINVTFNLLPPPVNNNNDTITYLAGVTPSINDETPADNSFILSQSVRGSIDPNEKQCLEGSKIDISKIGDYLHYEVHFQNEGTDTAFNIVVADTLSDKLDWNSFELISSSHPCNAKLTNNKAEFFFQNINLPYKAISEPASNGYVAFKIKPKPSLVVGDSLNNTAAIYFDFNLPVITNRATTVVTNASTPVPVKVEYFSISSRNNINTLNWKAACSNGLTKFSIERSDDGIHFSSIGSITATAERCQLPFNFTDNNPVACKNYYRLKITDADGIVFYSKILVTGNNRTGVQITGIANSIVYLNSDKKQKILLEIIAPDGKVILHTNKLVGQGNNILNIPLHDIASGIYLLTVYTDNGKMTTRKFIQ